MQCQPVRYFIYATAQQHALYILACGVRDEGWFDITKEISMIPGVKTYLSACLLPSESPFAHYITSWPEYLRWGLRDEFLIDEIFLDIDKAGHNCASASASQYFIAPTHLCFDAMAPALMRHQWCARPRPPPLVGYMRVVSGAYARLPTVCSKMVLHQRIFCYSS